MDSIKDIWSIYLETVLADKGLKKKELAELLNTTPPQITKWIKKDTFPNAETIDSIVDKLQIPLSIAFKEYSLENQVEEPQVFHYGLPPASNNVNKSIIFKSCIDIAATTIMLNEISKDMESLPGNTQMTNRIDDVIKKINESLKKILHEIEN